MGTCTWIDLSKEKPSKEDTYKVYKYLWDKWVYDFVLWDEEGECFYTPCEERPFIEEGVTHWLKIDEDEVPRKDAERKLRATETFFHKDGLDDFINTHRIVVYARYGNATEVITEGLTDSTLELLRSSFISHMRHIQVIL